MNMPILKVISKLRHLSQSEIAKMAHVSKQAVSLWFQKEESTINIQSTHLHALAQALHLKVDDLLTPLPLSEDSPDKISLKTSLLWDRLYPTLEDFAVALIQHKLKALSRLVEVYGLFESQSIVGKSIWTLFPKYKKYLPPVRRKQCEALWRLEQNQVLN